MTNQEALSTLFMLAIVGAVEELDSAKLDQVIEANGQLALALGPPTREDQEGERMTVQTHATTELARANVENATRTFREAQESLAYSLAIADLFGVSHDELATIVGADRKAVREWIATTSARVERGLPAPMISP